MALPPAAIDRATQVVLPVVREGDLCLRHGQSAKPDDSPLGVGIKCLEDSKKAHGADILVVDDLTGALSLEPEMRRDLIDRAPCYATETE